MGVGLSFVIGSYAWICLRGNVSMDRMTRRKYITLATAEQITRLQLPFLSA